MLVSLQAGMTISCKRSAKSKQKEFKEKRKQVKNVRNLGDIFIQWFIVVSISALTQWRHQDTQHVIIILENLSHSKKLMKKIANIFSFFNGKCSCSFVFTSHKIFRLFTGSQGFQKKKSYGVLYFLFQKDTYDKTVFWGKFTENLRKFNKLLFLYFINSKLTGKCRRQIWVLTFPESLVIKHFHTSKLK